MKNLLNINNFMLSTPVTDSLWAVIDRFFPIPTGEWTHFELDETSGRGVLLVLLGIFVGIYVGMVNYALMRVQCGRFVKKLLDVDATTPEKAQNLVDLGFFTNVTVREYLKRRNVLRLVVHCVEEDAYYKAKADASEGKKYSADYKGDFARDRFYIPEDLKIRAELRFLKDEIKPFVFPLALVLGVVVLAVLCRYLPDLLTLADNMITLMGL